MDNIYSKDYPCPDSIYVPSGLNWTVIYCNCTAHGGSDKYIYYQ